jgi:type I restriction enzyme M protein
MVETASPLTVKLNEKKGDIWSHLRQKWLSETPEERVRQEYLCVLVNEYGFVLEQMTEEMEVTGRGSGHARADFVIWRNAQEKADGKNPLIIVECKSDNVTIQAEDYGQGDNYARLTGSRFFVTHNSRETRYWRVVHDKMPKTLEEIENIPHAEATDKEIEALLAKLKVFKEDEFADLLHQCHNVIRNREKLDPAAAFDEIAKILFVKVDIERRLREGKARRNLFTAEFLDEQKQYYADPVDTLFKQTKDDYKDDKIFDPDEKINLRFNTVREIVKLLERYNLSDTSEDIKGIAFERFLGRTFRGEIGQFFTPRTIVEFMIRMLDPQEGEVVCDPASGSGGFLIRFFEIVRQKILADADRHYQEYKIEIEGYKLPDDKKAELLRKKYAEIQESLDQKKKGSRLWELANRCIYGTDANDRMARTSKMNMIMHGDGHGGVHHHDGFINVNGIFEGRFDIVLTNPPFGANVEPGDVVQEAEVQTSEELRQRYVAEYGAVYDAGQKKVEAAKGLPIASLFDLPKNNKSKIKTEILFIERCLNLLKPGGRMGIVLPEGVFNNPSLAYVREFCEQRAFIRAVVSLPPETFISSGASVKASLLFLQKFNLQEKAEFEKQQVTAAAEIQSKYAAQIAAETERLKAEIEAAKKTGNASKRKIAQKELSEYTKSMEAHNFSEARLLFRQRVDYLVFMYEAEHVGISATGEADYNELYPNDNPPPERDKSCLEWYQEFKKKPELFLLDNN